MFTWTCRNYRPSFGDHNVRTSAEVGAAFGELGHETCILCGISVVVLESLNNLFRRDSRSEAPIDEIPTRW